MQFYLIRVRLNSGGYDASGQYFGRGAPLYRYQCGNCTGHVRGNTRNHAKAEVRKLHGEASTFYR